MKQKVYITKIKETGIKPALKICFEHLIDQNIKPSDKVLIKPNFLNDSPAETGVTTDLKLLKGIIDLLKEHNIRDICIAEAGFTNTEKILRNLNVYQFENDGVKVINLEHDKKISFDFPSGRVLKRMVMPHHLVNSDIIINVPKLKTHSQTTVSIGIKNLFGFLYTQQRKIAHLTDINKSIVDVLAFIRHSLNKKIITVVDAIYALDGRLGPNIGKPVKMDLIISGSDSLSVDSACVKIMASNPKTVDHLFLCEQAGLGNLNGYEVIGEKISHIKRKFNLPFASTTLFPLAVKLVYRICKKQPYLKHPDLCIVCGICKNACPKNCIKLTNRPVINYRLCIGCLCCSEGCPKQVFDYRTKNALLYNIMLKIYERIKHFLKK